MMTIRAMRIQLFSPSQLISTSFWPLLFPKDIHIGRICLPIVSVPIFILLIIYKVCFVL